ncbi:MAG: DEAD/DEAH box helicase [Candidatus Gracilibacteria bacterium]|nr:DEAD/DEAH box helicase [Candidatus Gracilibacteria bacterium]MDQ7023335.1 DEAD/DEAH box helicase [Candidatus Gracilibacteria bacterium]
MFNLKEKIQKSINSKYWSRSASIFSSGKVLKIIVDESEDDIDFSSEVESSDGGEYYTSIEIVKESKKIKHYCSCPSHGVRLGCKHIGALARKIGEKYKISDSLSVLNINTSEILTDGIISDEEGSDLLEKYLNGFLSREDEYTLEKDIKKNIIKKENKLDIFSKLQKSSVELEKKEEEDLFKIKLDFIEDGYSNKKTFDIKIGVYKCKILKNGKLSAGTRIKKNALQYSDIPKNIQKLILFLDEAGNYRNQGSPGISFLDNSEYFSQNLFEFDKVFNSDNNKILNIDKNIYDLKISVKQKKDNIGEIKYEIKLILNTKNGEVFFKNFKIIGEDNNKNYACLRINSDLLFFKSDLGIDFISELNSGDLVLNKEEFEQLQSSKYFDNIIKHSYKVEDLGIEKKVGIPKGKIIIEIDEDFENVKTKIGFNYGGLNNVFLEDFENINFFIDDLKDTINRASTDKKNVDMSIYGISKIIIERDKISEKNIFNKLEKLKNISDENTSFGFTKKVDDNIDDFFDEVEKLLEEDFIIEYAQKTKRVSNQELGIKVNVKSGVDFFDTKTALTIGEKEIEECAELLNLLAKSKNKKSITLKNGMTVLLKNDLTKSLDLLGEMGINEKDIGKNVEISKHNIGLLKDKKLKGDLISFELDKETLKLKNSLTKFSGIRKIAVPENVKAELRDYQQTGYNWLNFLEKYNFSGFLADDMGLGKTLQALALLQKLYNNDKLKQKSLVVCPTSLVFNWLDEAKKFTPDLKVEYIKDGKTAFSEIKKETQVVIVSYGIIANLSEKGDLKERFHYLILDEAQNIKNPAAKRTKSICKIVSKYRLALSGTPIENNLMELWSGFNFLMPGFLNNLNNFKSKYMGTKAEKESMVILSAKVKPFILRRKKEDVLKELPAKVEEIIKLDMGAKQKAFYIKLKNAFKLQINKELEEQGLNKARFKVLDSLLKLRQACLTPELIANQTGIITNESVKLDYIKNSIDEMLNNGHNLLIFSQFTGFLKYVREILEEKEIEYNYLDGKTPAKNRKALVDEFNNGKKQVFIISLKAGGTGLNLTKADYVIHLDPWWNPAVENQATDRAHRMGQTKTVFVQKLICKDSIEEKILELQEKKKKLIDDVFSGNFSGSLSKEDIDFIFE